MLKIGIIGAGSVCGYHIDSYKANPNCEIVAIADLNLDIAKEKAEKNGIPSVYSDYKELLADKSIDAVSVLVPTFLHKEVVIAAFAAGKHVLCEKPPALNADEVRECVAASEKAGKVLMYALVCRFRNQSQYLKNYIASGKMGNIVSVDIERTSRCSAIGGWFMTKSRAGGGVMFDVGVHELDLMLYMMGYPKIKSVTGSVSYTNQNLPATVNGREAYYASSDNKKYETDVDTSASAYITFENGAYLFMKLSSVLMLVKPTYCNRICGEKAGAHLEPFSKDHKLEIVELGDDNYIHELKPIMEDGDPFRAEVDHFVDCCINGRECICKPEEAVTLMEALCAVYKSAELGETIYFD